MMKNYAHLKKESPFYGIFPYNFVPIKNGFPSPVRLLGSEEREAYMLDVAQCSVEQIDNIAELVAKQCGAAKAEVLDSLKAGVGMPIRASQVECVSSDLRAFI